MALEIDAVVDDGGDGVVEPGEDAALIVTVHNPGDARAYELYGMAGTGAAELTVDGQLTWYGTLPGGASVAEAPGEESLVFGLGIAGDCVEDGEAIVTVEVYEDPGDWAAPGAEISGDFPVPYRCPVGGDGDGDDGPDGGDPEGDGGCQCRHGAVPEGAWPLEGGLLVGLLLARRRGRRRH